MQSISFKLSDKGNAFTVDFEKFDITVLETICNILKDEHYEEILSIVVNKDLYKEMTNWLYLNFSCLYFKEDYIIDTYYLYFNGQKILINKENSIAYQYI